MATATTTAQTAARPEEETDPGLKIGFGGAWRKFILRWCGRHQATYTISHEYDYSAGGGGAEWPCGRNVVKRFYGFLGAIVDERRAEEEKEEKTKIVDHQETQRLSGRG